MFKFSNLPQKLINWVFYYLFSMLAVNVIITFGFELWDNNKLFRALYCVVFKMDKWLIKLMEKLSANLVFININIYNFYFVSKPKEPKSLYMVFYLGEISG